MTAIKEAASASGLALLGSLKYTVNKLRFQTADGTNGTARKALRLLHLWDQPGFQWGKSAQGPIGNCASSHSQMLHTLYTNK